MVVRDHKYCELPDFAVPMKEAALVRRQSREIGMFDEMVAPLDWIDDDMCNDCKQKLPSRREQLVGILEECKIEDFIGGH
jgi:hypothetical protein